MVMQSSLNIALKSSDLVIKNYVRSLESQNAKLKAEIGKLEAQNIGYKHEVIALKKEFKKLQSKHNPSLSLSTSTMRRASELLKKT